VYGQYADIQGDDALGQYLAGLSARGILEFDRASADAYNQAEAMIAEKEKRERGE
jgi:hypothetical protein